MKNINERPHLQQIINDILDCRKSKRAAWSCTSRAIRFVLRESVRRCSRRPSRRSRSTCGSLSLPIRRDRGGPDTVQADPDQPVSNPSSSAMREERSRSDRPGGNDLEFQVIDQGSDQARRARGLFRPFKQAASGRSTTARMDSDSPLPEAVELHGGSIWVESEWEGTRVCFRIPWCRYTSERMIQRAALDALQREHAASGTGKNPRPRVEDGAQRATCSALHRIGRLSVEIAHDGVEAVDMAKRSGQRHHSRLMLRSRTGAGAEELKRHPSASYPIIIVSIIDEKNIGSVWRGDYFVKP